MQTFLPYPDYARSARVLDRARLGKQRSECLQILAALLGDTPQYRNHPVTIMWEGCERELCIYSKAIINEWVDRGYTDNVCMEKTEAFMRRTLIDSGRPPLWMGDPELHRRHRSQLLMKDRGHYGPLFLPDEPDLVPGLPYLYPGKPGFPE